ncbi:MAG: TlpA family protein disulfide reductase [Bacteroidetes bacterium]|nr:TlpA family protein disulfide reductase [Bacteroidota bacterium]MBS1648149.1 TlpA family protein disulfide reductase [Bacteroidota bacterium]
MKLFFSVIAVLILNTIAFAQIKLTVNDKSIIKDSSGMVYPYSIWVKLMQTNQYGLRPVNAKDVKTEFIIYKLSEKQLASRDALTSKLPMPAESRFFRTGDKIHPFKDKDIEGNKLSIKDLKGKIVVLNFWFVACPPCKAEIPDLNRIVDKYKDNTDVVFIAIALDDAYAINEFLKTTPFKYHIIDNGRYIANGNYGITSYPTHVVIDKEGIIRFHTTGLGSGTVSWINKTIENLLKEENKQ